MAGEIRIYEQRKPTATENGSVECLFVYSGVRFTRNSQDLPLTPTAFLDPKLLSYFTTAEQLAIDQGRMAWEAVQIEILAGATRAERDDWLFTKYAASRLLFIASIVEPKSFDVEVLDLPPRFRSR